VSVCLFRGSVTTAEVSALLAQRLDYAPRWRRIVSGSPLAQQWVDDPLFSVDRHVTEITASDIKGVTEIVSGLLDTPLQPDRPLWQAVVVPGSRRTALVLRVSPALVDGYDAIHLLQESLDEFSAPIDPVLPEWTPRTAEGGVAGDAMSGVLRTLRDPRAVLSRVRSRVDNAVDGLSRVVIPQAGGQSVGSASVSVDRLRAIRRRHGVTTHDVLLALVAGGYRAWLESAGEPITDRIAQVPLATAEPDVLGSAIGCRIAPQWMALPLTLDDPVDALESIATLTAVRIDSRRLVPARELESLAGFAPPTLVAVGAATVTANRPFDILVVNAPGPSGRRYFGQSPMVSCHHLVARPSPRAVTATITSGHGTASFGIVTPSSAAGFATGIHRTVEALSGGTTDFEE
jgi:WS/DGAT/MGAT family acyltransferase